MIRSRHIRSLALVFFLFASPVWAQTKVVFVAGHDSHGPEAHEHTRGCHLLAGLLEDARPDIDAVVVSPGYPADSSVFEDAAAVVVYCDGGGGHLLNHHLEEFDALMKKGVGLVQLHYGVETTQGACGDKFLDWMGGYFETHWSVNPHWEATFVALPDHPISRGVTPFKILDEWYFHMRFRPEMENVTPILSAIAPAETMQRGDGPHSGNPVVRAEVAAGVPQHLAWAATRPEGGRGFGFTGGHFHRNWQDDNFRTVVENAICWVANLEIPAEGIRTRTPTDEEMQDRNLYVSRRDALQALEDSVTDYLPARNFELHEGLEITLWAKSPLFFNPTNMDIDQLGRVWVAEGRNYRNKRGAEGGDRIVVVEDRDGDGQADSSHVFVQEASFSAPLGIAVVDNRIIVSQTPDLIVYTDVNRNAVFDEGLDTREVLLTGFDGHNHDHSLHSVTVGPNGQYYFNHGNKGAQVTDREGWQLNAGSHYGRQDVAGMKSSDGQVYVGGVALRVNPDGTGLRPIGHNFRNSYEQALSSRGDVFQSDNDDPAACRTTWLMEYANMGFASRNGLRSWQADKLPGQETVVAEWRQEDPGVTPAGDVYGGGSPTGVAFYENGVLEEVLGGYVITCEPGRNCLFAYATKWDGAGVNLSARQVLLTSNPEGEFVGSDFRNPSTRGERNTHFRPSDVTVGPDGALYVADWWDPRVGGHQTHDEAQVGAIYRIAPKGVKLLVPTFDLTTTAGQIEALKNPSPNVRELGRARLEAAGESALPALRKLLKDPNPFIQARATWLLATLGRKGLATVEKRLAHRDPQCRLVAFRALRHENHNVLAHAVRLARDPSASVRREVALAMRYLPFEHSGDILLQIAAAYDGKDRHYVEAFGIGATGKEAMLYAALRDARGDVTDADPVYANLVWRLHPASAISELEGWALDPRREAAQRRAMLMAISLIEAPQAAASMVKIAKTGEGDVASLAKALVEKRAQGIWNAYKPMDALNGTVAGPVTYTDMIVPTQFGSPQALPEAAAILALEGDVTRGRTAIARCIMCHQVGSTGVMFGPALSEWGRDKSRDIILQALLDPSSDIAHGYEAEELSVEGDKRIQGFIQAEGDPVIVRVFGGQDVVVGAQDILSRRTLKRSLMVPADHLGMSAQELRDVVEFLKRGPSDD